MVKFIDLDKMSNNLKDLIENSFMDLYMTTRYNS